MKKLMISLAALTAVGAAVPAAAQPWGYGYNGYGYNGYGHNVGYTQQNSRYNQFEQRFADVSRRIDMAAQRGEISGAAANRLHREVREIARQANRFGRDGMDGREGYTVMAELQRVSDRLNDFRSNTRDRHTYSYGYGRGW